MGMQGIIHDPFDYVPEDAVAAAELTAGRQHELLVSQLLPPLANATYRKKVFAGNQLPAGAAPALWSATTQQCGLFNPSGSGVNLFLSTLAGTYVSGTGIVNGLALGYRNDCGATVTAGVGITAATTIAAQCLNLSGATSKGLFLSAGITAAAPTYLMKLGINEMVITAATTSLPNWNISYDFQGAVMLPPGSAIFVSADITGITAVYSFGLTWIEVKV